MASIRVRGGIGTPGVCRPSSSRRPTERGTGLYDAAIAIVACEGDGVLRIATVAAATTTAMSAPSRTLLAQT